MGALAIMVVAFVGHILMYQLYGKYIGSKIFALSGEVKTPSQELEDGVDYVPTKKEIISKIKVWGKEIEQDKVKAKLEILIHDYEHLRDHFMTDETQINLVMNNDQLSFSEAFRIKKKLMEIGIDIESVIVNKSQYRVVPDEISDEFNNQKIALFPFSSRNILGYQAINEYLDENSEIFAKLQ